MDAFDQIEEEIRRQEDRVRARELKQRLSELEKGLEKDLVEPPVEKTVKHTEPTQRHKMSLSKKITDIGKFMLVVVSVIVAIRLAAWVGTIVMVLGITWMAYKLFLESKE